MSATVQVVGLQQAVRNLEKLGVEAQDLKDAFQRIGTSATAAVHGAAPVRSGKLQSTVKQSKRKNSVYISAGSKKAYYAPYVEFGTSLQPAQHFMMDTMRKEAPAAQKMLEDEMNRLVASLGLDN